MSMYDVLVLALFIYYVKDSEAWKSVLEYPQVLMSARRMGLRDKGTEGHSYHSKCGTDVRIGITASQAAVDYCWRCECVVPDDPDEFDPDDGDEVVQTGEAPAEPVVPQQDATKVVTQLDPYRNRKKPKKK